MKFLWAAPSYRVHVSVFCCGPRGVNVPCHAHQPSISCQLVSFPVDNLPSRSGLLHYPPLALNTSILICPFSSSPSAPLAIVAIPGVASPPPFLCEADQVSSSLRARKQRVSCPFEAFETHHAYRFLLLQPDPLLILHQERMPGLFHVKIPATHFENLKGIVVEESCKGGEISPW